MHAKLRRLADLSAGEWLLLPQLIALAWAARVAVTVWGLPRLSGVLARWAGRGWAASLPVGQARVAPPRVAVLADLAARIADGPEHCLTRSLLLFWLLKASRSDVELLVGVSRQGGHLLGHAWVRAAGHIVGDRVETGDAFTPILRV